MKHKKTFITAIVTFTFLSISLLVKPTVDSLAKQALQKKLSSFKSDLRYENLDIQWSKIYLNNISMTKPRPFKAKELIVSLCYSFKDLVKPCNFELVEAELDIKLGSKNKYSKQNSPIKTRSVDRFMKLPIIARDLSINILDANAVSIAKLQNVDIDSYSEKGKFKFKLNKINYRSTPISSNIKGYLVSDIKGSYLPFEVSYSRQNSKEAWRLDGKLSKKLNKLKFKAKNNGIPKEWKQLVKGWIPEDSDISSTISGIIKRRHSSNLYFSIENIYKNINIDNSLLSDKTIESLPIKLKLLGMFAPKTGRLKLIRSHLETKDPSTRKAIKIDLELSKKDILNKGLADPLKLKLSMKKMSCTDFFKVIPEGILAESRGFSFSGDIAFDLKLSIPFSSAHLLKHKFKPNFSCQFESVPDNLNAELIRSHSLNVFSAPSPQQTAFMSDNYSPIDKISPRLIHSVVASEDAGYWKHKGVSFPILFSSLKHNLRLKKYAVGGSTISMQLAKNLFLSRDKNISRKVNEIFLSWYLKIGRAHV